MPINKYSKTARKIIVISMFIIGLIFFFKADGVMRLPIAVIFSIIPFMIGSITMPINKKIISVGDKIEGLTFKGFYYTFVTLFYSLDFYLLYLLARFILNEIVDSEIGYEPAKLLSGFIIVMLIISSIIIVPYSQLIITLFLRVKNEKKKIKINISVDYLRLRLYN